MTKPLGSSVKTFVVRGELLARAEVRRDLIFSPKVELAALIGPRRERKSLWKHQERLAQGDYWMGINHHPAP